ncbi:SAM-dependent methyltransferase, partial [Streptomyces sp. SID7982]|nr:SAM-dependent methyltransferase [Streptomyces sp. SID7982]
TLDFDRPIALSLLGLLHFLPDSEDPIGIIRTFTSTMASGSYVVLSQGASDVNEEVGQQSEDEYKKGGIPLALRSREEFSRFFEGLEIVA